MTCDSWRVYRFGFLTLRLPRMCRFEVFANLNGTLNLGETFQKKKKGCKTSGYWFVDGLKNDSSLLAILFCKFTGDTVCWVFAWGKWWSTSASHVDKWTSGEEGANKLKRIRSVSVAVAEWTDGIGLFGSRFPSTPFDGLFSQVEI